MELKITIIHEPTEEEPFLIVNKPKHLPSAPLKEGDESAYTQAENLFPELRKVEGKKNVEHGLVHRIDTETDGLLLIASTQRFYDWIQTVQTEGRFIKTYKAKCHEDLENGDGSFPVPPFYGNPISCPFKINSYFRFYGPKNSLVRPVTEECSRVIKNKATKILYETCIEKIEKGKGCFYVKCSIARGFKHQVRCHLAWCGLSIYGDKKYSASKDECDLQFTACGLDFMLQNNKNFHVEI